MKRFISVLLVVIISFSCLAVSASSQEVREGTIGVLTYNVAGLPVLGDARVSGKDAKGEARMEKLGNLVSEKSGCEIVGTQEDFDLNAGLVRGMVAYQYKTFTSGGIPLGDGLNVFSKYPIYNVKRTPWDKTYGVLSGSCDRLTNKGIIYCVVEIEEDIFIDLYVLHADAGRNKKSFEARGDNYRQIADMLNSREEDRAALVIGDFNTKFAWNEIDKPYEHLMVDAGLTDCWAVLCNGGDHLLEEGEEWNPTLEETYDRVMYKNGGGIEFTPLTYEYMPFENERGETYSDHVATKATLNYKVVGETSVPNELKVEEPFDQTKRFFDYVGAIFKTLYLIFTRFYEVFITIAEELGFKYHK